MAPRTLVVLAADAAPLHFSQEPVPAGSCGILLAERTDYSEEYALVRFPRPIGARLVLRSLLRTRRAK